MTPKEKALELVDKMSMGKSYQGVSEGLWLNSANNKYRHLCAIVAVDEIINTINTIHEVFNTPIDGNISYWKEVKKEIKIL